MAAQDYLRLGREACGIDATYLANELKLTATELSLYEGEPDTIPTGLLRRWQGLLSKTPALEPGNPYEPLAEAAKLVLSLVGELPYAISNDPFSREAIRCIGRCLTPPNLAFYGAFDAGKSHLINLLLNSTLLPCGYQPTTRMTIVLMHKQRQPAFCKHPIMLMDSGFQLHQRHYVEHMRQHRLAAGDYELLANHCVHGVGKYTVARCALVYMDHPLLLAATLFDIPGFASGLKSDDAARGLLKHTDALVFLSRSQGFMDDESINSLLDVLKFLPHFHPPINCPSSPHNLMVVASHAKMPVEQAALILDAGCSRLWNKGIALFHNHSQEEVSEKALRQQFFAFLGEDPIKRRALLEDILDLLKNRIPNYYRMTIIETLAYWEPAFTTQKNIRLYKEVSIKASCILENRF